MGGSTAATQQSTPERRGGWFRGTLGVVLALLLVSLLAVAWTTEPSAEDDLVETPITSSLGIAVIGDFPYTPFQQANLPKLISQIGSDPDVGLVVHLGDIKNSASPCGDEQFRRIKSKFDTFADPLVYTPGDNEWTDCHKPQNGKTNPLNRLEGLRNIFFASANTGLMQRTERYADYSSAGYPENVRFASTGTSFAAIHLVGANNGLQPWTGKRAATKEQKQEVSARTEAAVRVLREAFASAAGNGDQAIMLFTHADMFPPDPKLRTRAALSGYAPIVSALATEAAAYRGNVYLFNGDSHVYRTDRPLGKDSFWRKFYGITQPVDRLQRVTIDGDVQATNFVRIKIDRQDSDAPSWDRVPFSN